MSTTQNTFVAIDMPVTSLNTATKKREPVGNVTIYVPTLADLGITADRAINADKTLQSTEEGLPVYAEDMHNFIQDSIYASVKAIARNRLVSGTANLKDGASIPTDWATLLADIERSGNGEALKAFQELKALFNAWVAKLGKSTNAKELIMSLFANKKSLATQDSVNKGKIKAYVEEFSATLDADTLAKYMKPLQSIIDVCEQEITADDF